MASTHFDSLRVAEAYETAQLCMQFYPEPDSPSCGCPVLRCDLFRSGPKRAVSAESPDAPYEFLGNVKVRMRDGPALAANVYLPKGSGAYPVILMRTPYGKPGEKWDEARRYSARGFAMVVQDCRGNGASEGVWDPFRFDVEDGQDTLDWVAAQPWCDGQVGMAGGSYVGWTQWAAASHGHRNLRAMVPVVPFGEVYRDIDFGASAGFDAGAIQLQWFDYWLRRQDTGVENWPALRLFVMGENTWRDEHEWPLKRTRFTPYYFHSAGAANSRSGDGRLSLEQPVDTEAPADRFDYDPKNPVPTRGGNNLVGPAAGPYDQGEVEDRSDVLVYTSGPLEHPLETTGPVKVVLYAAPSATDTDFTAKLVDVHPDGKAYNLCDGILRARYRNAPTSIALTEPSTAYRYDIDLWVTSNLFKAGHRIRVEISSSNFPRFDRNPNSGMPFGADTELRIARQTVYHDRDRASHIILPVIPRPDLAATPP